MALGWRRRSGEVSGGGEVKRTRGKKRGAVVVRAWADVVWDVSSLRDSRQIFATVIQDWRPGLNSSSSLRDSTRGTTRTHTELGRAEVHPTTPCQDTGSIREYGIRGVGHGNSSSCSRGCSSSVREVRGLWMRGWM